MDSVVEQYTKPLLQEVEDLSSENQQLREELAALKADNDNLRFEVRSWRGA